MNVKFLTRAFSFSLNLYDSVKYVMHKFVNQPPKKSSIMKPCVHSRGVTQPNQSRWTSYVIRHKLPRSGLFPAVRSQCSVERRLSNDPAAPPTQPAARNSNWQTFICAILWVLKLLQHALSYTFMTHQLIFPQLQTFSAVSVGLGHICNVDPSPPDWWHLLVFLTSSRSCSTHRSGCWAAAASGQPGKHLVMTGSFGSWTWLAGWSCPRRDSVLGSDADWPEGWWTPRSWRSGRNPQLPGWTEEAERKSWRPEKLSNNLQPRHYDRVYINKSVQYVIRNNWKLKSQINDHI